MKATKFSQYIQSREILRHVDKPHWMYIVSAAVWGVVIVFGCLAISQYVFLNSPYYMGMEQGLTGFLNIILYYTNKVIVWGSVIGSITYLVMNIAFVLSTYIFATDRRLYIKTGVIFVKVSEVNFDEIRQTDISYGFFGRFIGYGRLLLDARFVDDSKVPFCSTPEKFSKLIHYENDLTKDINLSYVTNDGSKTVDDIIPPKHQGGDHDIKPMYEQVDYDRTLAKPKYSKNGLKPKRELHDDETIENTYEDDFAAATDDEFFEKYDRVHNQ